jgi:molecular chaperone GrpE
MVKMPKKKKDTPEEEVLEGEIVEDEIAPEEVARPEAEFDHPIDDQDRPKGGEIDLEGIPLEEKLELIQAALETSEAKAEEYLDGWQRAQAEFANFRKRQERERELTKFETIGRVVKRYLPIVDDMERALKERPAEGDGAAWAEGVELIYRKLISILEAEGVTPLEAEGEMFDPNLHEAVLQTPSEEHQSGQIIEVLQTGYMLGDRILRPAVVRVAA